MTIKAVFFDAGNTLLHQDYEELAQILGRLGLSADAEAVRRAEYRARIPLDRHLRSGHSTEDPATVRYYRDCLLRQIDPERRVNPEHFWKEIQERRRIRHPYAQSDPEAAEAAHRLKSEGFILGVISNADGSLAGLLQTTGLAAWFDVAIDSHVVGVEKPSPEIFHLACRQAGVAPREAVHIGDLPAIDAEPAATAGLAGWTLDPGDIWQDHALPRAASLTEFTQALIERR